MYSRRKKPQRILFVITLLPFLAVSLLKAQEFTCTGVVNGATLVLSNGEQVRLIGVALPPTKQLNKPA